MNKTNCDAMAALLEEFLDGDIYDADEGSLEKLENFEARVRDALTIHRIITERNQ